MSTRVEGQLWIDRNSPYRLKYFVKGEEYEVSVSQNYEGKSNTFYPGNVVKIGDDGKLAKAVFPRDIDRVIGIISSPSNEDSGETQRFSVSELDNIFISINDIVSIEGEEVKELNRVLVEGNLEELYSVSKSGDKFVFTPKEDIIGAPVYWFIGITESYRDEEEEEEDKKIKYIYTDSSKYPGLLTLNTPSGYQWKVTQIDDDSLNVGYSNLPIIGHISDIDDNGVTINLHMSGFQNVMEWSWPHFYSKEVTEEGIKKTIIVGLREGYSSTSSYERGSVTIPIRHGLFPKNEYDNNVVGRVRCFCDVIAMPSNEGSDTEYIVQAAVDNYISHKEEQLADPDRRTEIIISTPETLRYSITGRVLYNFNKEVISSQDVSSNEPSNTEITEEENN